MALSKTFVKKQKDSLLSEKEKLEKKIKSLKKYPKYDGQDDEGALALIDYEKNISIEEELEKTLKQVKLALAAIEAGTYGQCDKCKSAIESGRLESMPYAEVCVTCTKKTK